MSPAEEQPESSPSPSLLYGLSSLPDEMALNCFARVVSRLDMAALSTVSKSCHSVVVSPELYELRPQMGCKEECMYVFVDTPRRPTPRWFILRRGNGKSRLSPIPSFPTPRGAAIVSLGWGIYVLGGFIDSAKTSRVSFLDCRTHTWSYVPSMRVARADAVAGVLDGKIYVFGGCEEDPSKWAEVFDPKMQTWCSVPIPDSVMNNNLEVCKVYDEDNDVYSFPTVQGMWNDLNGCKIDRLLFCCDLNGTIRWSEPWSWVKQGRIKWSKVYGLDHLKRFWGLSTHMSYSGDMGDVWHCYMLNYGHKYGLLGLMPGMKLCNLGNNIVIFWDVLVGKDIMEIWCAEISLERGDGGRIWGTVLWSDVVLSIDPRINRGVCKVLCAVSINV